MGLLFGVAFMVLEICPFKDTLKHPIFCQIYIGKKNKNRLQNGIFHGKNKKVSTNKIIHSFLYKTDLAYRKITSMGSFERY